MKIQFIVVGWYYNQDSLHNGLKELNENNDNINVFYSCHKEPTQFMQPIEQPKEIKLDGMRTLDMTDHKEMNSLIESLQQVKPYVAKHKEIVTDIKSLVPDDCRKAIGNGIVLSRSKKGTLTLRESLGE